MLRVPLFHRHEKIMKKKEEKLEQSTKFMLSVCAQCACNYYE